MPALDGDYSGVEHLVMRQHWPSRVCTERLLCDSASTLKSKHNYAEPHVG